MNLNTPTLRLDPRFPVVWRTPTDLQIGVDAPLARLGRVGVAEERMLRALAKGVSIEGLRMIGASCPAGARSSSRLLARVSAAIVVAGRRRSGGALTPVSSSATSVRPLAGHRVAVVGGSTAVGAVRRFLGELGAEVGAVGAVGTVGAVGRVGAVGSVGVVGRVGESPGGRDSRDRDDPDAPPHPFAVAVIVSSWATPPPEAAVWLRRDIPHLDVVFSDSEVRVGPLVWPGDGPCLHCRERHRIDADPAWPAIAGQLYGRSAPTELPLTIARVLPAVADFCLQAVRQTGSGHPASPGTAGCEHRSGRVLHVDAVTGAVSETVLTTHPECACRALPEIGREHVPASDSRRSPPTRAPIAAVPG